MKYRSGYKYQLAETTRVVLPVAFPNSMTMESEFATVEGSVLTIKAGYAWDGPSGPTVDTRNFMRGSLVHDALYQLIRASLLPYWMRDTADRLLYMHIREDGMCWARANWIYWAVRWFGKYSADPAGRRPIVTVAE
jgi:hypothetical protein